MTARALQGLVISALLPDTLRIRAAPGFDTAKLPLSRRSYAASDASSDGANPCSIARRERYARVLVSIATSAKVPEANMLPALIAIKDLHAR